MKIGFIGIGLMGGPLARNLIRAGREVLFFARNKEHIEKTLSAGTTGKLVSSVRDLADCDIVFTCLPLGLLNHMKPHSVYIDTSTIDPHTAGEIEAYAAQKNIHYLGCTLGLGPAQAELAQEPIFAGGDKATFDRCKDILDIIGSPVHYLGGVKQAYAFKIISNMVGMTNLAVLAEGIHLAQRSGIDTNQFLELLEKDFANRFAVDLTLKDLTLGCDMAKKMNYTAQFTEKARDFYKQAKEEGYGKEDCCAVYKVLK